MNEFDAIVVGSGISGGWAAKELTEAGLTTLVLERGRNVEHVKDYPTAMLDPWQLPNGNRATQKDREEYYVQSDLYLFGQDSKHFLLDHRAALDLLGQQPADATKDRAEARLAQERSNVAAEDLTDALADQLQRQAIAAESRNQIPPIRRVA